MRILKLLEGLYQELKIYNEHIAEVKAKEEERELIRKSLPDPRSCTIGEFNNRGKLIKQLLKKGGAA